MFRKYRSDIQQEHLILHEHYNGEPSLEASGSGVSELEHKGEYMSLCITKVHHSTFFTPAHL